MATHRDATSDTERILLTGGGGFIGSRIARALVDAGHAVDVVVRPDGPDPPPRLQHALRGRRTDRVRILRRDLHDPRTSAALAALTPNRCIHAAWDVTPGRYHDSPENGRWVRSSLHLVDALLAHGCTWIAVTGTGAEPSPGATARSRYAAAKADLRERLEDRVHATPGAALLWLRIFQPFGPGEHPARFVPSLVRACHRGAPFTVNDPEAVRDFVHVDDIAAAVETAISRGMVGTADVATGRGTSLGDLAALVAARCGASEALRCCAAPAGAGADRLVGDPARLRDETGWSPAHALPDALDRLLADAMVGVGEVVVT